MAWNLPEEKPPADKAEAWLKKLNCFEGGRFHPLRFSVLLALLLLTVAALHDLAAAPNAALHPLFDFSAETKK